MRRDTKDKVKRGFCSRYQNGELILTPKSVCCNSIMLFSTKSQLYQIQLDTLEVSKRYRRWEIISNCHSIQGFGIKRKPISVLRCQYLVINELLKISRFNTRLMYWYQVVCKATSKWYIGHVLFCISMLGLYMIYKFFSTFYGFRTLTMSKFSYWTLDSMFLLFLPNLFI